MNDEINFIPESVRLAREISANIKPTPRWQHLHPTNEKLAEDVIGYHNDVYEVTLRRYKTGWPLDGGKWAAIGISSKDGAPRHDWRDFQQIKNDLVGADWEAVELYPDISRLIDPSNYYILWCAPKIPLGIYSGRIIQTPETCVAPQRGWEE